MSSSQQPQTSSYGQAFGPNFGLVLGSSAGAIKSAIKRRLTEYRRLYQDGGILELDGRVIQGLLRYDITCLLNANTDLQKYLEARRGRNCAVHGTIAGIIHLKLFASVRCFVRSDQRWPFWTLFELLGYPAALFRIAEYEWQLSSTKFLRNNLEGLLERINAGDQVQDRDVQWLDGPLWKSVPWHMIEPVW